MRLKTKWVILSFGGGIIIAVILLVLPGALFVSFPSSHDILADVVFWPVIICEYLVRPGPSLGRPSEHLHEGTPVNMLAAAIGIALSWVFWAYRRRFGLFGFAALLNAVKATADPSLRSG
ncbi:MAG TPA: hypothetical protein VGS10_05460 [Terracidiphilus sp.]|nr:hypothetical protein [Terracidiphilus sp.]